MARRMLPADYEQLPLPYKESLESTPNETIKTALGDYALGNCVEEEY